MAKGQKESRRRRDWKTNVSPLQDVSGSTGTAIGTIEYSVSNIVISQVAIQSTSATLRSGEGLDLSASGLSLHVDLNFHYKEKSFPHISGSKICEINLYTTLLWWTPLAFFLYSDSYVFNFVGASATVKVSNGGVSLVALPTNGHLEISLTSERWGTQRPVYLYRTTLASTLAV